MHVTPSDIPADSLSRESPQLQKLLDHVELAMLEVVVTIRAPGRAKKTELLDRASALSRGFRALVMRALEDADG